MSGVLGLELGDLLQEFVMGGVPVRSRGPGVPNSVALFYERRERSRKQPTVTRRSEAVRGQFVPPAVLPEHVETDGGTGEFDVGGGTAALLGDLHAVAVQGHEDRDLAGDGFGSGKDGVAVTVEIRDDPAPRCCLAAARSGPRS